MKKATLCILTLFVLLISACSSPMSGTGGEGSIVIRLGTTGGRAVYDWPPSDAMLEKINYVITLTGSATQTLTAKHGDTIRAAVTPGSWKIAVTAYLDGELYAEASVTADIKPGPNDVILNLKRSGDDGDTDIPDIIITVTVSTLAGDGTAGSANGAGTAASFNGPSGVVVDASGNVYVTDTFNNLIRNITPSGVVSTLAGSGTNGYADGAGTAASFNGPCSVAVDASGNVYVADQVNHRIRKIDSSGNVSTLAGSGISGYADGAGTAAQFFMPSSVAVDASGNVYVVDSYNHLIRKIDLVGNVSTLAGSGTNGYADGAGTAAQFAQPTGIAVDASGNVYVTDYYSPRIRKITPAGVVSTLAGNGISGYADGAGTAAQFAQPTSIAVDASGNVYVPDNSRIRKITPNGVVSTLAGSGTQGYADGAGTAAQFAQAYGVAVDASGTVYVADLDNNRIRVIKQN